MRSYPEMELDRLLSRGRFLGDLTEHVLGLAGLQPGMRVLDVGCGNGDVAFVAARLVGPDGAVIGVDRDPAAIDRARARASLGNVRFLAADAAELDLDVPIDAVIGRQVLMHLAEPAATLRHLRKLLAPGGLIAFQEPDWAGAARTRAARSWSSRSTASGRRCGVPGPTLGPACGCARSSSTRGWRTRGRSSARGSRAGRTRSCTRSSSPQPATCSATWNVPAWRRPTRSPSKHSRHGCGRKSSRPAPR
ncbi:class I SAM-dependent methyltransferase [Phytohabitans flavus]|uniref:class I SAM-dependent methyltransferase n=1 Tax=Phytohabitans flavus TaxID=1076124 RepID=UPI00362D76DB